jgi:DNA polymerase elongation subunit (family B)
MTVYFDVEILDWFQDPDIARLPRWRQHSALRFGLATTYSTFTGEYTTWMPDEIRALWKHLTQEPDLIVTWNGDEFDIPYIITQAIKGGYTTNDPWAALPQSLDLMSLIRRESKRLTGKERWYKLEVITQANLGRGKIGHGDEAASWLRSGDPELIRQAAEYCQDDVQLIRELHEQLLRGSPLVCPSRVDRREYDILRIGLD